MTCYPYRGPKSISKGVEDMKAVKNVAIILIVAGFLGLAYGSFSYTMKVNQTMIGSLALSIKEKQTVNVQVWGGVGAILIGGILLAYRSNKS